MRLTISVALLLAGCLPPGDAGPSLPRIWRLGLRADVVGCYAATRLPPRGAAPRDEWELLRVIEIDTARVNPAVAPRWLHLATSALARVHPGSTPPPQRLPALWRADSLTDSVSLRVNLGFATIGARVVRAADGSLRGVAVRTNEGVIWTKQDAARLNTTVGPVAWRAVPCRSLALNRALRVE